MKKIILLLAIILVCSCSTTKLVERYNLPDSGRTISVERFEMDGHDYICFTYAPFETYNYYKFSIVHDPDCKCVNNQKAEIKLLKAN